VKKITADSVLVLPSRVVTDMQTDWESMAREYTH
jgi:hypothetical protein